MTANVLLLFLTGCLNDMAGGVLRQPRMAAYVKDSMESLMSVSKSLNL